MFAAPPKSDEDLEQWKEKLAKGKKDGTHTYKRSKPFTVDTQAEQNQIAETIVGRVNKELGTEYKTYKEDVIKLLSPDGQTFYSEIKDIPKYKKVSELLWLDVSCDGDLDSYQKEFLKKEGTYFQIGSECGCLIDEEFFFTQYQVEFPQKDRAV